MNAIIQKFLSMIAVLAGLNLTYRQPGDGSDGTCDCIGLIIGAIRRMCLKWTGIHGSNYSARRETIGLQKITSLSQLRPGHVVYKAYEKGESGWTLDKYKRYLPGGAYYNGDLKDYYHVGVVTSINPVVITHMTSPTVKKQTVKTFSGLGRWGYFGQIKPVYNAGGKIEEAASEPVKTQEPAAETTPLPSTGSAAKVVSANGYPVKMRRKPSEKCGEWEKLPVGTVVTVDSPGEKWAKITYKRWKGWYMMAQFLDIQEEKTVG